MELIPQTVAHVLEVLSVFLGILFQSHVQQVSTAQRACPPFLVRYFDITQIWHKVTQRRVFLAPLAISVTTTAYLVSRSVIVQLLIIVQKVLRSRRLARLARLGIRLVEPTYQIVALVQVAISVLGKLQYTSLVRKERFALSVRQIPQHARPGTFALRFLANLVYARKITIVH